MLNVLKAEYIGETATFYIPCAKLPLIHNDLHDFLTTHYNAYTLESSNIQGYWREQPGSPIFKDASVKYVVSFDGKDRVETFVSFLSDICRRIEEKCIYLNMGRKAWLIKP